MCTRLDVIYASSYYLKVWTLICLKLHLEFRSFNDWNNFVRYCTMCEHALSAHINVHFSTYLSLMVALFMVFSVTYTICKGPKLSA